MDRRQFFMASSASALAVSLTASRPAWAAQEEYDPEKMIAELGLAMRDYKPSENAFQRYVTAGNMIYLSGTTPFVDGKRLHPGIVADTVTLEEGQEAAHRCAIQLLSVMRGALGGDWDKLEQVVRLEGFVRSAAGFGGQPKVMNAASDLMVKVLGARGRHTRTAIGVSELPFGSSVEIAAVISLRS